MEEGEEKPRAKRKASDGNGDRTARILAPETRSYLYHIVQWRFPGREEGENLVVAVDDDGLFTERITPFSAGRLVKPGSFVHSYPFCCRSDTPLIYRTVPSWFVQVELLKEQLLENNTQTHWIPYYVKVTEERSMIYIYYKYSSFRE
ncbi:hypothetical protein DY000_02027530 [Brassica cretica]|uniref:BAH domain-containing protein n=1 Tax=Brassica cretica TaxID=69181 RepID=A0ABQ7E211_BRACR|nr:hypothetical protein DY000_02027530 [Brassica cretica]